MTFWGGSVRDIFLFFLFLFLIMIFKTQVSIVGSILIQFFLDSQLGTIVGHSKPTLSIDYKPDRPFRYALISGMLLC
jgi:hypothetical protein